MAVERRGFASPRCAQGQRFSWRPGNRAGTDLMLTIRDEPSVDCHRLVLTGTLELTTVRLLDERVDCLIRDGEHKLEIDMTDVDFIDSKGLASLVSTQRKLRGENCSLILKIAPSAMRIFEVTGLVRYFEFA
jgi:anti-anti-sigma factor